MKNISFLLKGIFLCLFFLTACNKPEPNLEIKAKVSPISSEEYSSVGTKGLDEPKKDDFKVFDFSFKMDHSDAVNNRQVQIFENWRNTINGIDGIERYWYGSSSKQDNASQNFAEYHQQFVFYGKGLNDKDIEEAFNDAMITVLWTDKHNTEQKEQYIIADLIIFDSE